MKLRLIFFTFLSVIGLSVYSQSNNTDFVLIPGKNTPFEEEPCASHYLDQHLKNTDPVYRSAREAVESHVRNVVKQSKTNRSGGVNRGVVYTIPIVVHVFHEGEAEGSGTNISDAQIFSSINALIRDFRRNGDDGGIAQSGPLGLDAEIEFCFAKKDPNGNPTGGITRHDMSGNQGYLDSGVYHNAAQWRSDAAMKSTVQWDPVNYFNVWVVNKIKNLKTAHDPGYTGGVQGYATFPTGPASNGNDGAVMLYSCTGNDPTGTLGYNLWSATNDNRVFTHEIGHYLDLYHTFQGGSCAAESSCATQGDECCDTPPTTVGSGSNCSSPQCNGNENKENYMQYQNGACASDFTPDQIARMRALFAPGGAREQLAQNTNCLSPFPINPYVQFIQYPSDSSCTNNIIGKALVCNGGTSALTSFDIIYDIDGVGPQTYNWTGNLAGGDCDTVTFTMITTTNGTHNYNVRIDSVNINGSLPDDYSGDNSKTAPFYSINGSGLTVSMQTDCRADDISWELLDATGAIRAFGGPYLPGITTIFEEACLDSGCFTFKIYDAGGNGMMQSGLCPSAGTYELTDLSSGLTVAKIAPNPNFGSVAIHDFCLPFNPTITPDYSGCVDSIYPGGSVSFSDLSLSTPNIISWFWDFGDGSTSTLQNPSHTYTTLGTYNVKLVVCNAAICDSVITNNCVTVISPPPGFCDTLTNILPSDTLLAYNIVGGWGYYPGHNSSFLEGYAEPFTLSTPSNSIQKVMLPVVQASFGSPSSTFVLNVYADNSGKPGVTLSSDTILISSLVAGMVNEVSISSPPVLTGDFWVGFEVDYANGDTLGVLTASHRVSGFSTTYVKTGSSWDLVDSIASLSTSLGIKVVYTDLPAIGTYTVSANSICAGQTVTYDASSAYNYDNLTWYFPGGTPSTSTSTSVTVTYASGGVYDAILYLESICSSDSNKTTITVDGSAPVVSFTESALSACENDTVFFDGSGTTGTNLSTSWSFSGGSPLSSTQLKDTVLFSTGGSHNVTLSATNGCGSDSETKVMIVNSYPTSIINPKNITICEGDSTVLTGSGGNLYSWSGGTSNSTLTVTPAATTTYWLATSNGVCLGDTAYATVNINLIPTVVANATPDSICQGALVSFTMNGSNAIYYNWDFGDGNTSSAPNTTHLYSTIGTYTATLTGTYGVCDNTGQVVVKVIDCSSGGGTPGVDENSLGGLIKVFPNPANDILNIDGRNSQIEDLELELIDNTGKLIYKERLTQVNNSLLTIDLSSYSKGIYLLKFNTAYITTSKRLVIFK